MLQQEIKTHIKHHNYLTIAQFMKLALTHEEHGYYTKSDPLGKSGDFITAPEISQIFGELIGMWLISNWENMNSPKDFILVELGAGRGTLMADILRATAKIPNFHDNLTIHIIEVNDTLKQLQRKKLESFNIDIFWHENISELPKSPMLLVANEFFDALPIHQFIKRPEGWRERVITLDDNDNLTFNITDESTPQCAFAPSNYKEFADEAVYEFCPQANSIIEEISGHLTKNGGVGLVIDYGYWNSKLENTLQAVKNHKYHNPLEDIGEADLTSHVNFKHLANMALRAGANAHIGVTQGQFLEAMGITIRAAMLKKNCDEKSALEIEQAVKRLTSLTQMGELFKCMALTAPNLPIPYVFESN